MSKPRNIFLVRHAQSEANVDKSIYKTKPDYAMELTELGKQQALEAGVKIKEYLSTEYFRPEDEHIQFYVSPFWRTRQTYQLIKKSFTNSKVYNDSRIREQEWHGKLPVDGYSSADEMERDSYGHFYYRFLGGESCADVFDRVSGFLDTLHRDFEKIDYPNNCIIVTHGMALRIFCMRWLHLSVEEFEVLKNPKNCEFQVLSLNKFGKYELKTELKKWDKPLHNYQYDWKKLG